MSPGYEKRIMKLSHMGKLKDIKEIHTFSTEWGKCGENQIMVVYYRMRH